MRRATGQHLLIAAGVLLLAGCGAGAVPAAAPDAMSTADAGTAMATAPTTDGTGLTDETTAPPGQGTLADSPAFTEEFDAGTEAWPTPGAFDEGEYVLASGTAVDVPYQVPAEALGALAEVGVTMTDGGATSLTCDLGESGLVVLRLAADGSYTVTQQVAATTTELAAATLPAGQRGEPGELTALRLLCSDSPDGLAVALSLHGAGLSFVEGVQGEMPAQGPAWSVQASGEVSSLLDTVLVTLVED